VVSFARKPTGCCPVADLPRNARLDTRENGMMRICFILLSVLALAFANGEAWAQAWPTKPIRAVVAFSAGGIVDVMTRVVCDQLSSQLRQPVVVENRGGAGTTIGTAFVAKSDPDGYTILVNSSAHTISPLLQPNLTFDPARDFSAVIPLGVSPNVLVVSPSRGLKTVGDLVAAARAKPGSFNFASAGVGSGVHMSAERFLASAGIVAVHVPFKGSPEAITEVMAGRVDFYFSPVGLVVEHIRERKLLALAVNSPRRAAILPEVPTLAEAGVADAEYPLWYGSFVHARTPRHIVETLHREMSKTLKTPNVENKLAALGLEPMVMTPAEFDAHVKAEFRTNAALISVAGIK
jgi:tripartite-type tricarboxylate transporter receptor subunit TctC